MTRALPWLTALALAACGPGASDAAQSLFVDDAGTPDTAPADTGPTAPDADVAADTDTAGTPVWPLWAYWDEAGATLRINCGAYDLLVTLYDDAVARVYYRQSSDPEAPRS